MTSLLEERTGPGRTYLGLRRQESVEPDIVELIAIPNIRKARRIGEDTLIDRLDQTRTRTYPFGLVVQHPQGTREVYLRPRIIHGEDGPIAFCGEYCLLDERYGLCVSGDKVFQPDGRHDIDDPGVIRRMTRTGTVDAREALLQYEHSLRERLEERL